MVLFEGVLVVLVGAVLLSALARRFGAPYPAFLALAGAALALVPGIPAVALDPELVLALFVAPVLLDAAYDASPRDLRENWRPISGLVFIAVGLTTAGVATLAHWMVPAIPWAAAIALGAIVAPPDAAAASAILRKVGLPHRLLVILEGESLLNDATALLLYRVAVSAAVAGSFAPGQALGLLALVLLGGAAFGAALGGVWIWLTRGVEDPPSAIILQFVATFGVWLVADRLGVSPIIAVVAYAIVVARFASERTAAQLRVPSYAVWATMVFVLQVLAFVLIGLQLRPILAGLSAVERAEYLRVALAVLAAVVLIRLVWVMLYNTAIRWKNRVFGVSLPRPMLPPTFAGGVIISWCGMRGIVTLAAAYALPANFPFRDLILLCAFTVVLGTLVLQGLTLGPLIRWFDLHDDRPVEREVEAARTRALAAAIATLDGDHSPAANALRREYREALRDGHEGADSAHNQLRRRAIEAARSVIVEMRRDAEIGDDAFHVLEALFDRLELGATPATVEG